MPHRNRTAGTFKEPLTLTELPWGPRMCLLWAWCCSCSDCTDSSWLKQTFALRVDTHTIKDIHRVIKMLPMQDVLQLSARRPASVTGVSHRFRTWRQARCSDNNLSPASPNWSMEQSKLLGICRLIDSHDFLVQLFVLGPFTCVDQRLSCLSEGSLMSCSAQALVTLVKARLRFSKFPKEPELSRRARSAS